MTHDHAYDQHPNPAWSTHAACTICGFAAPKAALLRSLNGCSLPRVKPEQLSRFLRAEFAIDIDPSDDPPLGECSFCGDRFWDEGEMRLHEVADCVGGDDRFAQFDTWEEWRGER